MPAAAATAGSAGSPAAPWAYGVVKSVDVHAQNANYEFKGTALYGFSAILQESSPAPGVFTVTLVRTMGVILAVVYCLPDCSLPLYVGNLHYRAWENATASANLTNASSVNEGSGSVPALGLLNASASVTAGIRESVSYGRGSQVVFARQLSANLSGSVEVNLSPSLGLVPLNLTPGSIWTATSAFTANGSYQWSYQAAKWGTLFGNLTWTNASNSGVVNRSGNISVVGSLPTGSSVELGGTTYAAVNLTVIGPFAVREGFVLVPAGADLFGGARTGPSSAQFGSATVTDTHLDLGSHFATGRLGIVGSGTLWRSGAANPALTVSGASGTALAPITPSAGAGATYVQAEPESVSQAQTDQQCLSTGVSCPGGTAAAKGLLAEIVLVAVGAVALAAVVGTTYNRRRVPPPAYPNAALYPPGTPVGAAPTGGNPPPVPPPETDDPLGHLW